ncbi:hypothetical protein SBA3_2310004 [Candidatus Sulfopaludibacter sp. SbA3]|nr:hypothetical protein SBA3_2310004 [Candidatus Sulfopaludibacter sp. SbA3]
MWVRTGWGQFTPVAWGGGPGIFSYPKYAFNLFNRSAASGCRPAAMTLSNCYAIGLGVALNPQLARYRARRARRRPVLRG